MIRLLLLFVWGSLFAPLAAAMETPSTLLITGSVEAGGGIRPALNDRILVFDPATEQVVDRGSVVSRQGLFSVTMTRTSDFDGTQLTLLLQQDGRRFQLYEGGRPNDGGVPADFVYQGGLVPRRASITVTVGEQVGGASPDDGSGSEGDGTGGGDGGGSSGNGGGGVAPEEPSTASRFDVNDDGVVDQVDIELVKDVVAGRPVSSTVELRADVNGDEIVNTRDIIGVIKAATREERSRRRARVEATVPRL